VNQPIAATCVTTLQRAPVAAAAAPAQEAIFPETLALDARRIEDAQSEVQLIALVGTIILLVQQRVSQHGVVISVIQQYELKVRIEKLLREPRPTMEIITNGVAAEVAKLLAPMLKDDVVQEVVLASKTLIKEAIDQAATLEQPLFKILVSRLSEVIESGILSGTDVGQLLTDSENTYKGRFSLLRPFSEEIKTLVGKISRVISHHEKVHHFLYKDVVCAARCRY